MAVAAIILSSISLGLLVNLNSKIESMTNTIGNLGTKISTIEATVEHEQAEELEVGAPGISENEFYIFTQELDADEQRLGIPVAVYSVSEIIVHKGDRVTIHFINAAEDPEDRHTFTMQKPYAMNYDLAGGQSTSFSFTADNVGTFTYYCTYDLPSMVGQLVVLP